MLQLPFILIGACATVWSIYALGRVAWRYHPPHWTYALASGAPLFSAIVFLLLTAGAARPAVLYALMGACLLTLARARKRGRRVWGFELASLPLLCLAVYFVFYLVHALAPEIRPDAAGYHLGLVAEWLRTGRFAPRIGFYEMLPLGLETLFLPAFAIGAHSAAKLVHFAFLCASVPLMMRIGRQLGMSGGAALGAAALYAISPIVGISGTCAYNDAALVFFGLAVFALLVEDHAAPDGRLLLHAGLAAGFCYAIKMPGLLTVAAALGWLLWRRRTRGAALFGAGALVSIAPWMLRNLVLTGNPLAPLANGIFPNDSFYRVSEEYLTHYLRTYNGVSWTSIPWELAVSGARLQGLIGPLVLLTPLALLALRKPAGRALLAAAAILLLPWTSNIGARFVMPALPFLYLALAMALPRPAVLALVLLQSVASLPPAMDLYTAKYSWRLAGFPWKAALRVQPEQEYLAQNLGDYSVVQMVNRHVNARDRILDLFGLPYSYTPVAPVSAMPSALTDDIVQTLDFSARPLPVTLYKMRCQWPLEFLRGIRVRLNQPRPYTWCINEVALYRNGKRVEVSRNWFLDASPAPGSAWLAIDGNPATRWDSWDPAKPGMYWKLAFDRPVPLDGASLLLPNLTDRGYITVEVQGMDKRWRAAPDTLSIHVTAPNSYKRAAMAFIKRQGFEWIAIRTGAQGHGKTGRSFEDAPAKWGVELVDRTNGAELFRVQ